jgi:hypothetical protein
LARAKRTDRTAARRRYRAELATQAAPTEEGETLAPNTLAKDAAKPRTAATAPRMGITAAFRASFRPLDLRGDLAVLPQVVTSWALIVAVVAGIASTAAFILSSNDLGASLDFSLKDPYAGKSFSAVSNLSFLVVGFFVTPPPAAGAFLVGFFARRASWLGGLVVGIVAAVCYTAVLVSPAGRLLIRDSAPGTFVIQAAVLAPVGGLLFAAAAAWYKRFLNIANPNRGARSPRSTGKPKARPAAGRGAARR